jgi:predicted DNA-binding protein (MmcQ/YjbR family)
MKPTPSAVSLKDFDRYCKSFRGSTKVVQWGGAHVWKVGGKMFAICWGDPESFGITFKVDPQTFDFLKTTPGCRPAPYLASRGMKWIQWFAPDQVSWDDLQTYLRESYQLIAAKLPKRTRAKLGIPEPQ